MLTIREYFSRAEYVVEGQLRMLAKYQGDCVYPFFYAAREIEAWGGEVLFREDGPPNAGAPVISDVEKIPDLKPPQVSKSPCLQEVLAAIRGLFARVGGQVPIIGVVMSPFSVPVMQLGFERYLDLILTRPELFEHLMRLNESFCVEWANAQLEAGATAMCYFDPVSSPTVIPPELYRRTGCPAAKRTLARINGPTATHLASGRTLGILDDLAGTGTAAIGVGSLEDLAELKARTYGKLTLIGNLNGIAMCRWSAGEAQAAVREAIAKAAPGGGFILSDQHGEIPFQVPEETLLALGEAVRRWGAYPKMG